MNPARQWARYPCAHKKTLAIGVTASPLVPAALANDGDFAGKVGIRSAPPQTRLKSLRGRGPGRDSFTTRTLVAGRVGRARIR